MKTPERRKQTRNTAIPRATSTNPFSLKFTPATERAFLQDYYFHTILQTRPAIILGFVFYISFYLLDLLVVPEVAHSYFIIRFMIVGPAIILIYLLSYSRFFFRFNQLINLCGILLSGGGIVAMTLIRPEYSTPYYAGIILVLIYDYILMGLRFYWAAAAGWLVTLSYVISMLFWTALPLGVTSENFFFLVGANILLMFGAYFTEVLRRRDFYLRFQLKTEQAKVETINAGLETRIAQRTADLSKEIGDRKAAQQRTQRALEEKEVLLREVYHRTKNNMTVVISLLNLQAAEQHKHPVEDGFQQVADRIYSMSLVHEQLYRSTDLTTIDFIEYLRTLVLKLQSDFQQLGRQIEVDFACDPLAIGLQDAVPLGLIVNEILTNSIKHGFSDGSSGQISISSYGSLSDGLTLSITNNGIAFPTTVDLKHPSTLGLRLIQMLAEDQLGGKLSVTSDELVCYTLELGGELD